MRKMVSKEKLYRDKRRMIMRNCIFLLEDLMMLAKKSQIGMIDLVFLKKLEKELQRYHDLFFPSSKIPIKIGETTE
jgi:hypothetical protein